MRVEPAALQPADVLLDLYGEDIRARAFVTRDEGAEMMLRPDFTVPIVRLHMDAGAEPARYVYCGPVWRRQERGLGRGRGSILQAGFEVFEGGDPAAHDAEVLGLIVEALGDAPVELVTGDLGLVLAAIDALETSAARKAALRRHVWRPARFHALLRQFGEEHAAVRARRAALLAAEAEGRTPALVGAGVAVGLRGADEVAARVAQLAEEAATPPLAAGGRGADRGGAGGEGARAGGGGRAAGAGARACRGWRRRSTGSRRGSRPSRRAGSRRRRCASRRASGGPRSNTTTAWSSGRCRAGATTCRRWRAAGATTR